MNFKTRTGYSEKNKINVYGYDLSEELIGKITLVDMAFLGAKHRKPTSEESKMLNAVLVSICEHGFTPSSLSTRLTYLGSPESSQGAVAAGLLGAGTIYLGAVEQVSKMLIEGYKKYGDKKTLTESARLIINDYEKMGIQLPGFGHPIHKPTDPRTEKLFEISKELDFYKEYSQLLKEIHRQFVSKKGRNITLNALGAIGAILTDMNFNHTVMRPLTVASRAIGLVSHIIEEEELGRKNSVAQSLFDFVEENTEYKNY